MTRLITAREELALRECVSQMRGVPTGRWLVVSIIGRALGRRLFVRLCVWADRRGVS